MLKERFFLLEDKITRACDVAGRNRSKIKVLLASKTQKVETLQECISLGYHYFGENRLQELQEKQKFVIDPDVTWDFIGHLQSKKVKDVVSQVDCIHSVDSLKLIHEIQKRASQANIKQKILLEINTSHEASKGGAKPSDLEPLLQGISKQVNIKFAGLMTIATNTQDSNEVRRCFQDLYKLRKDAARITGQKENDLELSMGMSNDYEIAIQEGATTIRIGSLVFGTRS